MIGIFIGITAIISLISLGEGLRSAIAGQLNFLGPDVLAIRAAGLEFAGPPGQVEANPLSDELIDKVADIPNVDVAYGRYLESTTIEFNKKQVIVVVASVPDGKNRQAFEEMVNLKEEEGRLLKDADGKKAVLGNYFKNEDVFGRRIEVGDKIIVNSTQFEVVGILEKKGSFFFDYAIFVNEKAMFDNIREKDSTVNMISLRVKDVEQIEQTKENINQLLRKERNVREGEEDFVVETPQKIIGTINSTLFSVQIFVYVIAAISLLVGGIGIANTMYTSVLERTKEIGIMKSVGAKNSTIFSLFFVESGLLGLIGGVIGIFFGLSIAYSFAFIGKLIFGSNLIRVKASFMLIFGALFFSFIIGLLAGILPAYQAAKKNPVDALRFAK
ncbi:MAG TPA: ABC transporter permease [Candidatus Nanoarchaeia archaeon]|nr:ABC transporter permease [Candidatus Nanoarchaeia archaeon]